jgi:hypothetical protein
MPVTRNNTPAGNVTNFPSLGAGRFFERCSDEQLYVKLDGETATKVGDYSQNYSMGDEAVIEVAADALNVTYDP